MDNKQAALVIRGLFICTFAFSHWQNWLPSSIGNIVTTMLVNYATLATNIIAVLTVMILYFILNATPTEKLSTFPYYDMIQFQSHACPFIASGFLVVSYYIS